MVPVLESLNKLLTTLKKISDEIIPPEHIGTKAPKVTEDLPSIVASVKKIEESPIGIGGVVLSEKIGEDAIREVKGFKSVAIYQIEIWANSPEKIEEITNALAEILFQNRNELRKERFVDFFIDSMGEIESRKIEEADVWKRRVTYKGMYEQMTPKTIGPEGIVKKIHVDIEDQLKESMVIEKK